MRVALATCAVKPEPDPDEEPLLAALHERGVDACVLAWDDAESDWQRVDLVVLRSTWNYAEQPERFVRWLDTLSPRVLNPVAIARDNLDKRYLIDLPKRGVPTVPTHVFDSTTASLKATLDERGWHDVVIKPVVGAASFRTKHFRDGHGPEAAAFLQAELQHRAMMVQPYQCNVDTTGERALVWIDGEVSHAVRKTPRFAGEDEQVSSALPISDPERAVAEAALAPFASELLYARVDVIDDGTGQPQVMELELVEPSLFLVQHPPALERLATAIARQKS